MPTLVLGLNKEATQADVLAQLVLAVAKLNATLLTSLDASTLAALETVSVNNFPGAFAVSNLPGTYNTRFLSQGADSVQSYDHYDSGEVLADQSGSGAVLTFTFTTPVDLVFVQAKSAAGTSQARVDPFGGTPSASQGIPAEDGAPQPIPFRTGTVKVFAPTGMTVSVWGYRYV